MDPSYMAALRRKNEEPGFPGPSSAHHAACRFFHASLTALTCAGVKFHDVPLASFALAKCRRRYGRTKAFATRSAESLPASDAASSDGVMVLISFVATWIHLLSRVSFSFITHSLSYGSQSDMRSKYVFLTTCLTTQHIMLCRLQNRWTHVRTRIRSHGPELNGHAEIKKKRERGFPRPLEHLTPGASSKPPSPPSPEQESGSSWCPSRPSRERSDGAGTAGRTPWRRAPRNRRQREPLPAPWELSSSLPLCFTSFRLLIAYVVYHRGARAYA